MTGRTLRGVYLGTRVYGRLVVRLQERFCLRRRPQHDAGRNDHCSDDG
jgi:hypothetical protein